MEYPSYEKYQPSRLEWLDVIPQSWGVTRIRLLSSRYSGGTPSKDKPEYWQEGTIPWLNSGAVNQGTITKPSTYITELGLKESSAKWIPEGAIIIALAGQGKTKGTAAYTTFKTTCNQSMGVIVFEKDYPRFMYWWLVSQYKNIRGMASDDARDGLNLEMLGTIPCPLPNMPEQQKIAAFLDYKTQKIDQLIEKKKALIEKLEEKRIAVITQAVTKGLDKKTKLKPSGVDWLGDVPEHWKTNYKFKFLSLSQRNSFVNGPFGSDLLTSEIVNEGVPVIYSGDVKASGFRRKSNGYVTEMKAQQLDFCRADPGDFFMAKVGAPPGDACVYSYDEPSAIVTQDVVRAKLDDNEVSVEYLCFLFNSLYGKHLMKLISVEATRGRFSLADLKALRLLIPPKDEQLKIVEYIHEQILAREKIRKLIESEVDILNEYRSAIITSAVTGKIDVGDVEVPGKIA